MADTNPDDGDETVPWDLRAELLRVVLHGLRFMEPTDANLHAALLAHDAMALAEPDASGVPHRAADHSYLAATAQRALIKCCEMPPAARRGFLDTTYERMVLWWSDRYAERRATGEDAALLGDDPDTVAELVTHAAAIRRRPPG